MMCNPTRAQYTLFVEQCACDHSARKVVDCCFGNLEFGSCDQWRCEPVAVWSTHSNTNFVHYIEDTGQSRVLRM